MSTPRLIVLSVAAVAFAAYETGVAYLRPDTSNLIWAAFAWICVLFAAGLWWEARRNK
jgi:hypothetical protein